LSAGSAPARAAGALCTRRVVERPEVELRDLLRERRLARGVRRARLLAHEQTREPPVVAGLPRDLLQGAERLDVAAVQPERALEVLDGLVEVRAPLPLDPPEPDLDLGAPPLAGRRGVLEHLDALLPVPALPCKRESAARARTSRVALEDAPKISTARSASPSRSADPPARTSARAPRVSPPAPPPRGPRKSTCQSSAHRRLAGARSPRSSG
jgi:hypothetical protein